MKLCKQVKFIQGEDLADLQRKLNGYLVEGAELGGIDIHTLTGAVIVTEYVGDIKKTLLDELEDEMGRHHCEECPYFRESADKRVKWHFCEKHRRKTRKTSCCCETYYREEGARDLSEDKRENERIRPQNGGRRGNAESIPASSIRPFEWSEQVPPVGVRVIIENAEHTARYFV